MHELIYENMENCPEKFDTFLTLLTDLAFWLGLQNSRYLITNKFILYDRFFSDFLM